jgi:uncharacterized protein YqjF (DUF2071 family)
VHRDGKEPGVWFFSLDAERWLACMIARATYHLPYHHAKMSMEGCDRQRVYRSERCRGGSSLTAEYSIGERLQGDFDTWLVERYRLYAHTPRGLYTGLVHHEPYPVFTAQLAHFETDLPQACGLSRTPLEHVCYSPGVKVEVFAIKRCD